MSFTALRTTLTVLLYYFVKECHVIFVVFFFSCSRLGSFLLVFFLLLLLGCCLSCCGRPILVLSGCRRWPVADHCLSLRLFRLASSCVRVLASTVCPSTHCILGNYLFLFRRLPVQRIHIHGVAARHRTDLGSDSCRTKCLEVWINLVQFLCKILGDEFGAGWLVCFKNFCMFGPCRIYLGSWLYTWWCW